MQGKWLKKRREKANKWFHILQDILTFVHRSPLFPHPCTSGECDKHQVSSYLS